MPLTPELMKLMDNGPLIAAVRCELDPLTSTPLELELLRRLEVNLDSEDELSEFAEVAENHDLTAEDFARLADALIVDTDTTVALLGVINDEGYDAATALRRILDIANDFHAIAADLQGDAIHRLNTLIQSTQ